MSKKANKTVIGGFVVGALALVVGGILVFGSGKFLKERYTFVMYFDGSVKGLNQGAPVVLRGVKIGTVTKIVLRAYPDATFEIPVFIEVEPDRWERVAVGERKKPEVAMKLLIERGFRAQLQMQSLVTGQLMVELDFHPDRPAILKGKDPEYVEIPTIPADLEELKEQIEKVPIEEIFEKLLSAVEGIEKVVNSPELIGSVHSLKKTLDSAQELVEHVDSWVKPIASGIDGTVKDARKLVRNVDNQIGPLASSIEDTADAATEAVLQAKHTLKEIESTAGEDSVLSYELTSALRELSDAARSIRLLTDYISRHPESLIRGKGGSK